MRLIPLILLLTVMIVNDLICQAQNSNYKEIGYKAVRETNVVPSDFPPSYSPTLYNLEAPSPDGNSLKSFVLRQKVRSKIQFPRRKVKKINNKSTTLQPIVGKGFGMIRRNAVGKESTIIGGRPNDNTMAISNEGIVLLAMNSMLYAYDINNDSILFSSYSIDLSIMSGESSFGSFYFDPYLMYDEISDRFILVFLKNSDPATNKIFICFSSSSDPNDSWNVYSLPGNPLNNNRWTDYPEVSMTEKDVFITANLIIPDSSWQVGFDGSVIWQIEKEDGYNNESELNTKLYSDIRHDGRLIRNLHAVKGAGGVADKQYLLSNRNFDIQNDTIFVLDIDGDLEDGNPVLTVTMAKSDIAYGVPPNGRQEDTGTLDATSGLQTNDARVLGAIKLDDQIQFVSNSVNPETGLAAVFHGTITNLLAPEVKGTIVGSTSLDYGYPNIAWMGKETCDIEAIIAFNYTSPTDYAGIGAVYYDNEGNYSNFLRTKEGSNYVDRTSISTNERWGDYFGLQRKFNDNGEKVYSFGFFGTEDKKNSGWCTELFNPYAEETTHCLKDLGESSAAYPNPFYDQLSVQFKLDQDEIVKAKLYDFNGNLLTEIMERKASKGLNEFSFSLSPLSAGQYILEISSGEQLFLTQKIVKQ